MDDDVSMREALAELIASNGMHVVCFASAREFLAYPAHPRPSCIVADVRMPGMSGFDLQRELVRSGREQIPLIFMTAHGDIPMAVRAVKAGAFEFLPKPFRTEALLASIHEALKRDSDTQGRQTELARLRERRARLTEREDEVLVRVGNGMRNKQIAAALGVSENTIKAHRNHIMRKMGAATSTELVKMMERMG